MFNIKPMHIHSADLEAELCEGLHDSEPRKVQGSHR